MSDFIPMQQSTYSEKRDTDNRAIDPIAQRIGELIAEMTLEEKIGQLNLVNGHSGQIPDWMRSQVASGQIGSILNEIDVNTVNELQAIAVHDSRLGIPLLIGRDVIHGFNTVFPIPLGQAATWNADLIEKGAHIAAQEAASVGINWTFAPMMDIGRDARWGRVAETLGEDPLLAGLLSTAMIRGFEGENLAEIGRIAACAKHFAGYGASEAGKDYNNTHIPENELRNVHLPPFEAAVRAGVASFMTSFSEIDGIPATGNVFLLDQILRKEWQYNGFVVSDWDSIQQLQVHGLTANESESALEAVVAGVDMDMNSGVYHRTLHHLVQTGQIVEGRLDQLVENVLRAKFRLGLFDNAHTDPKHFLVPGHQLHLDAAYEAALQSLVLLKNERNTLPLSLDTLKRITIVGPFADDADEQMGTWVFDGDPTLSQTPLKALRELLPNDVTISVDRLIDHSWSREAHELDRALHDAQQSDAIVAFMGEEAILSGEAHCRADIRLPGIQADLLKRLGEGDTPLILVVQAGRPLVLTDVLPHVDAVIFAWHGGSMAGPAIVDILFGRKEPSGRLPVTFPKMIGQIPIYYAHKNTGKPATPESMVRIEEIDPRAAQVSIGNTSFHLDAGVDPLFPFGFGLSYTSFAYSDLVLSAHEVELGGSITIDVSVTNTGSRNGFETVQLYVRDLVGNVTRPVRELKGFQRIALSPGEIRRIRFSLHNDQLSFVNRHMKRVTEPGDHHVWVGGDSNASLGAAFKVV